jgi:superfamily I DNA/RNA helicase
VNNYWGLQVYFGKGQLNWTEQQKEIISAEPDARFIVNAMPGAGKTAVACAKISNLIDEGVTPSNIWLVSFTRTAVQELRDRIASFADEEDDVIGVKIATIDSRAWQLRYGMRSDETKSLFDNYDLSISNAIDVLDESSEELEDFFGDLEHVIIDEAQDITGYPASVHRKDYRKITSFLWYLYFW